MLRRVSDIERCVASPAPTHLFQSIASVAHGVNHRRSDGAANTNVGSRARENKGRGG